jgi:hypothetical protein
MIRVAVSENQVLSALFLLVRDCGGERFFGDGQLLLHPALETFRDPPSSPAPRRGRLSRRRVSL